MVLGWGQGAQAPQILPSPPNFWLVSGVYWGYIGVRGYTPYTNLWCFLTAYNNNYLICHNKTGYTGIGLYALTENKRVCTAPCRTKLLNFFPCTFCLTCNAYSWEALLAYNLISIKTSYNTIKVRPKTINIICLQICFKFLIFWCLVSAGSVFQRPGTAKVKVCSPNEVQCAASWL